MNRLVWFCILIVCLLLFYILVLENITFHPLSLKFPAFAKTRLGVSADPINIMIIGNQQSFTQTFLRSGWVIPDPTTIQTAKQIIIASIHNKPYSKAPISNLYLFKRKEDLAFEFPTNTARKRHHIRLWKTTYTLENKSVWVGSDTFDSRIELSHIDLLPTHHVDANINQERNFLINTLQKTHTTKNVQFYWITPPVILKFNGNGDWFYDDGKIAVITENL